MRINISPRFKRSYKKLSKKIKKDFDEKIDAFIKNPRNRKLRTHKLQGNLQSCLSFYLCDGNRVLFEFAGHDEVNLLDIGPHDKYAQWKKR